MCRRPPVLADQGDGGGEAASLEEVYLGDMGEVGEGSV